jgi:aryl-alcohol dehydrogenase-like predicted oxidoreductase
MIGGQRRVLMEHVRLGKTGMKVSRIALGCMSYGDPATPGAHTWALDDDDAQPFFRQAVEMGITFWDTANTYQFGTSEEVVGRAIRRYSRREDIVLATKVWGWMHDGPGGQGLSRKAILEQADALPEALAALDLHLTGDEIRSLEEPYTPHGPAWY